MDLSQHQSTSMIMHNLHGYCELSWLNYWSCWQWWWWSVTKSCVSVIVWSNVCGLRELYKFITSSNLYVFIDVSATGVASSPLDFPAVNTEQPDVDIRKLLRPVVSVHRLFFFSDMYHLFDPPVHFCCLAFSDQWPWPDL